MVFNYSTNIRKIIDIKKSRGNYFAKTFGYIQKLLQKPLVIVY